MVCRHLKLPLVTLEVFEKVITPYVEGISCDEWMSLDAYDSKSEVGILLVDMCRALIGEITNLVLETVELQSLASNHFHSNGDDVAVQNEVSRCRVAEQDVQACFRNSLHRYFGEALDVAKESSQNLDQLVRLFSAEITKSVNSSLAQLTRSTLSFYVYDLPPAECIFPMVHNIGRIFKYTLDGYKRMEDKSCDTVVYPRCNCEKCWGSDSQDAENAEQESTETLELSDSSANTDHTNDWSPERAPQFSDYSESYHFVSSSSHPPRPEFLINKTFLVVVLAKLVDHIAAKTRTSVLNVDLEQLVNAVSMRTRGMMVFVLPKKVDSLHISIYKTLCKKFRSKYVLQAVMESGDEAFEFAVSMTLMSLLQKSKTMKKRWTPINPGNLSPILESPTPESDDEERSGNVSPVPDSPTPESDDEERSGNVSPVPESPTPESDDEERSGNVSPVPESPTPESDDEERSGNVSPVPESLTPEPDSEEKREQTSPSPPKKSLGRTIRKKLSRWVSNVVNFFNDGLDSEIHRLDYSVTPPVLTNPLL